MNRQVHSENERPKLQDKSAIAPTFPAPSGKPKKPYFLTARRRRHDLRREILDAILYVVKTGCQWRTLPGEFAPWRAAHYYFDQWREEGRLQCLLSALRRTVRREAGRRGEPSAPVPDCQTVQNSRSVGIASFDVYKHVKGRKWHVVTDAQELL